MTERRGKCTNTATGRKPSKRRGVEVMAVGEGTGRCPPRVRHVPPRWLSPTRHPHTNVSEFAPRTGHRSGRCIGASAEISRSRSLHRRPRLDGWWSTGQVPRTAQVMHTARLYTARHDTTTTSQPPACVAGCASSASAAQSLSRRSNRPAMLSVAGMYVGSRTYGRDLGMVEMGLSTLLQLNMHVPCRSP